MINYNYYTRTLIILVVVFVILKYVINVHLYDAILLTCIIVTSYLIIEKVLTLNGSASNPTNCDQCTIPSRRENFKGYNENDNIDYSANNAISTSYYNPNAYAPTTTEAINTTNQSNAPIMNPIQFNMQPNDPPLHLLQPVPAYTPDKQPTYNDVGLFPDPNKDLPTFDSYMQPKPDNQSNPDLPVGLYPDPN